MPLLDMKVSEDRTVIYIGGRPPNHAWMYVARDLTYEERAIMRDYYRSEVDQAVIRRRSKSRFPYILLVLILVASLAVTSYGGSHDSIGIILVAIAIFAFGIYIGPDLLERKLDAEKIVRLIDACGQDGVCYSWGDTVGYIPNRPLRALLRKEFGQRMDSIFYDRRVELAKRLPNVKVKERPFERPSLGYLLGSEECRKANPVLVQEVDRLVSEYLNTATKQIRMAQEGKLSQEMAEKIHGQIEIKAAETLRKVDELVQTYGFNAPWTTADEAITLRELGSDIIEQANRDVADQNAQAWIDGVPFVDPPRP